ncbi:MAG: hypothetical protein PVJ63_00455 [Thioalkalispiraceae bacterium]
MTDVPAQGISYQFKRPSEVIKIYNHAVARHELRVFDYILSQQMLNPHHVEYRYELDNPYPQIKVHTGLIEPLPVPGNPACKITDITSILDRSGHIQGTIAHIHLCDE